MVGTSCLSGLSSNVTSSERITFLTTYQKQSSGPLYHILLFDFHRSIYQYSKSLIIFWLLLLLLEYNRHKSKYLVCLVPYCTLSAHHGT